MDGLYTSLTDVLSSAVGAIGISLAVLYAWMKFFDVVESNIRPELRQQIGGWLLKKGEEPTRISEAPSQFVAIFDSVFGKRHLTIRCFALSSLLSVLGFTFIALIIGIVFWDASPRLDLAGVLATLAIAAVCNMVPDYVSLLETRLLLRVLTRRNPGPVRILAVLLIDAVLTFAITVVGLFIAACVFSGGIGAGIETFSSALAYLFMGEEPVAHTFGEALAHLGDAINLKISIVVFLTAYITSVWLWLYVIGGIIVRAGAGYRLFVKWVPVEEKPLKSIGFAGGMVCAFCYLVWYLAASPVRSLAGSA